MQEFYLGLWSLDNQAKFAEEIKTIQEKKVPPKTVKLMSIALPAIEMVMDGGKIYLLIYLLWHTFEERDLMCK